MLLWERTDRAFFAAGACHILAWAFVRQFPDRGFGVVALRKLGESNAFHVYASDGTLAFDYEGFTPEHDLLAATDAAEAASGPIERLAVTTSMETFCSEHDHREPADYAYLPWERARTYIRQFLWPERSAAG